MRQIRSPLNALTHALIMHLLWPSATMAECVNLHTALLFFNSLGVVSCESIHTDSSPPKIISRLDGELASTGSGCSGKQKTKPPSNLRRLLALLLSWTPLGFPLEPAGPLRCA